MDKNITTLGFLDRLVENLKKEGKTADSEITFEFLIGSCFPSCWENVNNALTREFIKGYNEGAGLKVLNKE